ncbi:PspC domain-containing protein [Kribbella aluminosa]|uniref:PspC domain-containing protein n=1 Tax=Kribbella aluminosa TaxID=416017 RepID=UPI0031D7A846
MEQNQTGPAGFDRNRLQNPQTWRRSRSDRWVAGVCGGIGRGLNIDPVLVRVLMAVLIISGPGLIFYLAAWALMPEEGSDRAPVQGLLGDRIRTDHPWFWPVVIGICVFAGIATMSSFKFGHFIPGPLIVIAIIWLISKHRKGNCAKNGRQRPQDSVPPANPGQPYTSQPYTSQPYTSQPYTSQPTTQPYSSAQDPSAQYPSAYGPPQTGPSASPAGPSSSATQRPQDRTGEPVQSVWTEDDPLGLYADEPAAGTRPPATSKPAGPPAKGMRGVKSIVVVLTGLAIAIAALAGATTSTMLVIGLATLGGGMLLGGFVGRTLGLLPLGILLAMGAVVSTVFTAVPRNFADTNYVAPQGQTITATGSSYQFDAGSVNLDLTKAKFAPGAKVEVHGGAGEVVVKLPANVDVKGQLSTEMGNVAFLNEDRSGHNAKLTLDDLGADAKPGEQVTLDLNLKLGSIKVERG